MRTKIAFSRFIPVALAVLCLAPSLAYCDGESTSPPGGGPMVAPWAAREPAAEKPRGANNETFKTLKSKCETEVVCGKGNGDICADAAALLLGDDPPDEFRETGEAQKVKIALRLLEKGVDSSNIAAGRAYDLYGKTEVFGFGSLGGFSDPYRANELMDMMIKKSYPGGPLRKALAALSIFAFSAEDAKKQACVTAKQFLAGGKLDADSTRIANEIMDSNTCKTPGK